MPSTKKAKRTIRFKNVRRAPCPACLDRGALNLLGRPIYVRGMKLTGGCELCQGSGEVAEGVLVGDPHEDPWVLRAAA